MRKGLFRFIILLLVFMVAWTFGYMKLPYIESDYTFWIGFVSCLAIVFCFILINPKNTSFSANNRDKVVKIEKSTKHPKNHWILILAAVSLGFGLFTFLNNRNLKTALDKKNKQLFTAEHSLELSQQSQKLGLILALINQLDSAAKDSSKEHLIQRIVTLSSSFKTFQVFDTTNPLAKNYSMERGQLLLALVNTKMDSTSYRKLKENVSFWGAELAKVDLHGLDLSGIDLRFANLQEANLQGINMSNANLTGANLMGCNLNEAVLNGINLHRTNLSWAKVNNADMQNSVLDSANFSSATIRNSNLSNSNMFWTNLNYALLNESNLSGSQIVYATMAKTNLRNSILIEVSLRITDIKDVILDGAVVSKNWFDKQSIENSPYLIDFMKHFEITEDIIDSSDSVIYRLNSKQ